MCPFTDTEHLAQLADVGKDLIEQQIVEIQEMLKKNCPTMHKQITLLDDLYLAAITAAQNTTLRNAVCTFCNQNTLCHPTP
jgi:hypothetical protein